MEKICTICQQTKQLDDFEKNARYKGGHVHQCKSCRYAKHILWNKNNKEKVHTHNQRRRRRSLEKDPNCERKRNDKYKTTMAGKLKGWKADANKRKILWELTLEDLESMPKICHYTKQELTMERGHFHSISLDRVDSSKGYTKDNVVFCCKIVNLMKIDLNVNDFIHWCKIVAENN